jgi:hypothetical protein
MAFNAYVNTGRCMAMDVDALTATGINTSTDIQNGYFVTLGDYQNTTGAINEFVYSVTLAAASTMGNWLVRTPEVGITVAEQMEDDPRYFINHKGQPMQLIRTMPGVDEIEVTVEALDQAAAKGDYYTLVAGKLTKGAVATDATCFLCLGTHTINFGGEDVTTYIFRCVAN